MGSIWHNASAMPVRKRKKRISRHVLQLVCSILIAAVFYLLFSQGSSSVPAEQRAIRPHGTAEANQTAARGPALLRRIWNALDRLHRDDGRPPPSSPHEEEKIRVYFAPCDPYDAEGIDNALKTFVESARESIWCAAYDLEHPELADVLIAQHARGMDVRIVSDSQYEQRDAVRQCIGAGIPVVFDRRGAFMHNKFCVVDGRRVWTGSTNFTQNGMYRNNNNSLVVDSERLAANYETEFLEMFRDKRFGRRSPRNTPFPEVMVNSARILCYFAPEDGVLEKVLDEIRKAESAVDVMAFAFTSEDIALALVDRIGSGVRVRAIFEQRNAAAPSSRDEFLARHGAEVYLDANPYSMHHKVMILDRITVITGSYNFTASAEKDNDENVLIIRSASVAALYGQEFERLMN